MAIILEGGCRITKMREGPPVESGTLRVWPQIGRRTGAQAISLRILEFAPGVSPELRNEACDEILYVLGHWDQGQGPLAPSNLSQEQAANHCATIFIDGRPCEIGSATGIYLQPGHTLTVDNPQTAPIVMISSQCPEPLEEGVETARTLTASAAPSPPPDRPPIVRLADRPTLPTADRWYRVLVDDEVGSTQVTQFVGSIPPGRAPDHFHIYEEVLFILRGSGRMWAGETHTPISAGSCVYLPRGQIHCVENTGNDELRLLGVFYPAGSPSVRYEVD
jgi:mannose-6-phosphate isomerase-like protein (cupin superfamily)